MKRVLVIVFIFLSSKGISQTPSIIPLKADSIIMFKSGGGYAEFVLRNRTKDTLGYLYNLGNGITEFRTISGASGSSWNITGNSGITGSNFIGTINNATLKFRVNNQPYGFLESAITGGQNTALGDSTLAGLAGGSDNVAFGYHSLSVNEDGTFNTGIGSSSLEDNISGESNTAIGGAALQNNTTGNFNSALGQSAIILNTTGEFNSAIGFNALPSNTTGSYNIGLGNQAGLGRNSSNTLYVSDNTTQGYWKLDSTTGTAPNVIGKDGLGFWHVYAPYSASNGLTLTGSAVKLGGALTANTTIDVGSNQLVFNTTSASSYTVNRQTSATSGAFNSMNLVANSTTGNTFSDGFGSFFEFEAKGPNGVVRNLAGVEGVRDGNDSSGRLNLITFNSTLTANTVSEIGRLGQWKFNNYGVGTFAGTPAYNLQVDASGNVIEGSIGGGGSGNTNSNIGSGFRLAVPGTNNVKTLFNGYAVGIDSSSNTNGLTLKADSSLLQTKLLTNKLRDSLSVMISAKSDTSNVTQPADYIIEKVGSTYYARPGYKNGRATISNSDAYTVIQGAINVLTASAARGAGGGHIHIKTGTYPLTDELLISGWEIKSPAFPGYSQLTITGDGKSTYITQATSGKNGIVIKNNASVSLKSMRIECTSVSARSALRFDPNGADSISCFGGNFDDLYLIATSSTYPALYMANFFDLNFGTITCVNTSCDAIIIENVSSSILYGNSNFGFVRAIASTSSPFAGLRIKSNDGANYHCINLMSFSNYECVSGYYGVHISDGSNITFGMVDIEYGTIGFHIGGGTIARHNYILSGVIAVATSGGTCIETSLGGNTFNCQLGGSFSNVIPIHDTQAFEPPNSYDVILSSTLLPANIAITYLNRTYLRYRNTSLARTYTAFGDNTSATTQSAGDNTTALATTAFVTTADNLKVNFSDTASMLSKYYYKSGNIGDSILLLYHGSNVVDTFLFRTSGGGGTVNSVSGTTNRITSTGGTTPVIDISATFEALLGKVANPLSQFASTTSAQFIGVISDGTGTGLAVFNSTPTIITPSFTTGFTIGGAAATGKFIVGNGTNYIASTSTIPTSAGATANKILLSDGTNYVLSTPTFPNASATTRKIIVSDGTNWTASTETYAVPGTSGNFLQSNGTNWTSATTLGAVNGGTGAATYTTGDILYASATNTLSKLPIGSTGKKLTVVGGIPAWVDSTAVGAATLIVGSSAVTGGTTTRILYDNAGVLGEYTVTGTGTTAVLSTSPTLVTPVLGVATATSINKVAITAPATSSTLTVADGSSLITSGAFATTLTSTATSNATIPAGTNTLYSTLSGSVTSAQLATTLTNETGSGSVVFSVAPTFTGTTSTGDLLPSGNYAQTLGDATHNWNTVYAGIMWSDTYRTPSTTMSVQATDGTKMLTAFNSTTNILIQNGGTHTDNGTDKLQVGGTILSGKAGTTIGGFKLSGNTSGTISILPQAAAGTYNFNMPITAGAAGDFLTSQGGSSTAMTWTTPPTNTGTGNNVLATSPTLVTPILGVATATSINKVTITAPATSSILTVADGSTLATSGSFVLTLTSTGTTNSTFPAGTSTLYSTSSGSITSAQLATSLTNETGTGNAVFSASPTFTGTLTAADITASGNLTLNTAGNKILITEGSNASVGTATFSSGTVTVTTSACTTSSRVFISRTSTSGNTGAQIKAVVASGSFVVTSMGTNGATTTTDAGAFDWWVIN